MKKRPEHIAEADWHAVASPLLSDDVLACMKPARRVRGPQKSPTKVLTTLRLDADVVDHFKRDGQGWQTRINEALRRVVGE